MDYAYPTHSRRPDARLFTIAPCHLGNLVYLSPLFQGAFIIDLVFPPEYPFKPPKVSFRTKIYHPNIDEKGQVCLPIVAAENWKPATKTEQVIQSLVGLVNDPEPDHPLRADLAGE